MTKDIAIGETYHNRKCDAKSWSKILSSTVFWPPRDLACYKPVISWSRIITKKKMTRTTVGKLMTVIKRRK